MPTDIKCQQMVSRQARVPNKEIGRYVEVLVDV